ncbi:acyltransferase [Caballeronia sp. LjRoot34]|uniref:acyltransferase family protein n=1 Tax=Caballeronia sp. LjRoot34 TaxID=3342325 RepID=UPI003ECD738B
MTPTRPTTEYENNVQVLRFVAAAVVLITHITFYLHERVDPGLHVWHVGEAGVPLFFVISGFVMALSGSRLERNAKGAAYFLRKRVARIFPLYWVITTFKVAIAIAVPAAVLHNRPDILHTLGSYFLIPMTNSEGDVRPIHGVAWTLLHEMLFYYIFSLSLLLRQKPVLFSSGIIISMCSLALFVSPQTAASRVCLNDINLLFVAGMFLASMYKRGHRLPRYVAAVALTAGIICIASDDVSMLLHRLFLNFNIGAVLIVAALLSVEFTFAPKFKAFFVRLGGGSYSLYLIHPIVAPAICVVLFKMHVHSIPILILAAFSASVFLGQCVFNWIEKPLSRRAADFLNKLTGPYPGLSLAAKE